MSDDRAAPHAMPDRIAIDAKGYGWRVWDDTGYWSMVPVNPDNSPIPQPVTWFVPEVGREADRRRITELAAAARAYLDATTNPTWDEYGRWRHEPQREALRSVLAAGR